MFYRENYQYLIRKFINIIMVDGKKIKAEKHFYKSLMILKSREKNDPVVVFLEALNSSKPSIEIRSVRRGGATYQIPVPLSEKRAISLAMKWVVQAARQKKGVFSSSLANVLMEAAKNQGESVRKKENIHTIALKNRSLTHFRWF